MHRLATASPELPDTVYTGYGTGSGFADFVATEKHSSLRNPHAREGFDRAHTTENEGGSVVLPVNDVSTDAPSPFATAIRAARTVVSLRTWSGSENGMFTAAAILRLCTASSNVRVGR